MPSGASASPFRGTRFEGFRPRSEAFGRLFQRLLDASLNHFLSGWQERQERRGLGKATLLRLLPLQLQLCGRRAGDLRRQQVRGATSDSHLGPRRPGGALEGTRLLGRQLGKERRGGQAVRPGCADFPVIFIHFHSIFMHFPHLARARTASFCSQRPLPTVFFHGFPEIMHANAMTFMVTQGGEVGRQPKQALATSRPARRAEVAGEPAWLARDLDGSHHGAVGPAGARVHHRQVATTTCT